MNGVVRIAAAAIVLGMSGSFGVGVAQADHPPAVNPALLPPGDPAVPPVATEFPSNSKCADIITGGDAPTPPAAWKSLGLERAWQFSKGAGQLVAVIDTGVARHKRLPGLIPGGDFVANPGDGTEDCDAHGTFVAGLIAASQVDGSWFSGVAPEARILSIRQTSKAYQEKGAAQNKSPDSLPDGFGRLSTIAASIRRAVDMHATVINISIDWCGPSNDLDGDVGAAVQYAFQNNVVVVAAAGNNDTEPCKPVNTVVDPLNPTADPWKNVVVNVSPARWDDYVLSVGSISDNGAPSTFTVPGPWVGVAAPGENLVSLNPLSDGLATGRNFQNQQTSISGTSFAAPLVTGVVALVRARYPQLSAGEVIKRIEATAHAPYGGWNQYVGYGSVDPIAALTAEVSSAPLQPKLPALPKTNQLATPAAPPPPDNSARDVALIGTGIIAGTLILGYLASFPIRRKFGVRSDEM